MQLLSNFFTGTENLFKLLFINGLIMILVALFYPLQKSDELDIQIVEHNKNTKLLNKEISTLKEESQSIRNQVKNWNDEIIIAKNRDKQKINPLQKDSLLKVIDKLKLSSRDSAERLRKKIGEVDRKTIEVENEREKIKHLTSQLQTYDAYSSAFLFFGILTSFVGLFGWSYLTFFILQKEYDDYKQRISSSPPTGISIVYKVLFFVFLGISLILLSILIFRN